jgi:hypothetical protein
MVLGKFKAILLMISLEKRALLLDNRGKPILLKDISNYLGADKVGDDVINKIGTLDSIVLVVIW